MLIQRFVSELAVKAFHECILCRFRGSGQSQQFKQQFLVHLYGVAENSTGLPVDINSVAVETYRLQLQRYIDLTRQRLHKLKI